jgi:hypothetical protein
VNTESHHQNVPLAWLPPTGHQLRKAGVHFDAVRVAGILGQRLVDRLEELVYGGPGPVIAQATGDRPTYFLVPPGTTAYRSRPPDVTRLTGGQHRACYVGVPALSGPTWPLSWRCPPTPDGHLVHPLILHSTLCALTGWPG